MSDSSRPAPDVPSETPRFEVPLAGPGLSSDPANAPGSSDADRPSNWRRIAGLSALAGAVVGIVLAVVVLATGTDDGSPTTTVAPDELADAISVPPTLTPVTEPPAYPAVPRTLGTSADLPTDVLRTATSVDTLPPRLDVDPETITGFALSDGSLAALDTPLPRRSETDYVVGVDGFEQTVTITNDPATGRYLIEVDFGSDAVRTVVVDLSGGRSYVEASPGEWTSIPNDEVAADAGAPDMATFVRNLQLGPIRSDTRVGWELAQPNSLVDSPGEELREYVVVLDAGVVPEWARYVLGPRGEVAPLPDDTPIGYAVYVAADGSIRRVSGWAAYGATSQRIVHRLVTLDSPPVIELPEPSTTGSSLP